MSVRHLLRQSFHVHLKRGQEHDVVEAHPSEQLEAGVTRQYVEAILTHSHTRQHHADDMGDAKLAHDDGCQQNDEQHHEEDERGVGDGKVTVQMGHACVFR